MYECAQMYIMRTNISFKMGYLQIVKYLLSIVWLV